MAGCGHTNVTRFARLMVPLYTNPNTLTTCILPDTEPVGGNELSSLGIDLPVWAVL